MQADVDNGTCCPLHVLDILLLSLHPPNANSIASGGSPQTPSLPPGVSPGDGRAPPRQHGSSARFSYCTSLDGIIVGVAARESGKDGVAPSRVAVAPATAPLGAVVNVAAALYHAPEHASTEFHSILEAVIVVLRLVHCLGGDERVGLDNAGSGLSDDVNDGQITQLVSENSLHHPHEWLI